MTTSNGNNMLTFGMLDQAGTFLYFFKGKLDDIGIWNRVLDTCEIKALFHSQLWCNKTTGLQTIAPYNSGTLGQNTPNPFTEETVISYNITDDFEKAYIILRNATGQILSNTLIEATGSGTLSLNTESLQPGIYLYSLVIDGKIVSSKKMVKH